MASDEAPVLSAPLSGLSVLVVENHEDSRTILETMLSMQGADVVAVASVHEAFEAIDRLAPDVVLSDISMPAEDGFDLIRKLRARAPEAGGRIPAIALTGRSSPADRDALLEAGYQAYLTKPAESHLLVATIRRLTQL